MLKIVLALCVLLAFTSCLKKNDQESTPIDGHWKVVSITELSGSRTLLPPVPASYQPILIFKEGGFSGATPANQIGDGTFAMTGSTGIRFTGFTSTEVSEGEFGTAMFAVLNSCLVQSLAPCTPATITWDTPSQISIDSRFGLTLHLERN